MAWRRLAIAEAGIRVLAAIASAATRRFDRREVGAAPLGSLARDPDVIVRFGRCPIRPIDSLQVPCVVYLPEAWASQ
jgi:hypothetical protein